MINKVMLFLGLLLMVSVSAYADEKYSISVQVKFSGHENIFVSIYTRDEFKDFRKSLPSSKFSQKIKLSPEQIKEGRFFLKFSEVPKGSYCIIAFQDIDNNGKLTCDTWGHIEEPIFYYKEPGEEALIGTPSWDQVEFELVRDMAGIVMKLD